MTKLLLLAAILLGWSYEAQARGGGGGGVLFSTNVFMYNQTNTTSPGSTSDDNISIYDFKLGYISGNLYLGGIYTSRTHNGSALTSETGTATGASIGYMGDAGFYLMGHYYISATRGDYSEGKGYQADFGYMANVTGVFHVGVEMTYRAITYGKHKTNTALDSYEAKELFPMLTAAFLF